MKKLFAICLSVVLVLSLGTAVCADNQYNDVEVDWTGVMGTVSVGSATGRTGQTVTVPVSITKNPGIVSLKVAVQYDTTQLELVGVEAGDFGSTQGDVPALSFGPIEKAPFIINWVDALTHENNTATGVLANLTFKIKEGATGTTTVSVDYAEEDAFDVDLKSVLFRTEAGTVTVTTYVPGDINDDGKVNVRDLGLLQQHLNGWDVVIYEAAADTNDDGKVNVRDLGLLQQYLNGWDVELG